MLGNECVWIHTADFECFKLNYFEDFSEVRKFKNKWDYRYG